MKTYVGIDPGVNGALCVIWGDNTIDAYKCPNTASKMAELVRKIVNHCYVESWNFTVGIEKVWARPTNATRAAFTFGTNYGTWLGVLASNNIDPLLILPKQWQSVYTKFGKLPKDYVEKKRKLKIIAQTFVKFNVTLITADSILIAKYLTHNIKNRKENIHERKRISQDKRNRKKKTD